MLGSDSQASPKMTSSFRQTDGYSVPKLVLLQIIGALSCCCCYYWQALQTQCKLICAWDTHLAVKGRVLNLCIDEHPQVVLHHEGLHIVVLALLVQLLHQVPGK